MSAHATPVRPRQPITVPVAIRHMTNRKIREFQAPLICSCGMPSYLCIALHAGGPFFHIHCLDHRILAEFSFDIQ